MISLKAAPGPARSPLTPTAGTSMVPSPSLSPPAWRMAISSGLWRRRRTTATTTTPIPSAMPATPPRARCLTSGPPRVSWPPTAPPSSTTDKWCGTPPMTPSPCSMFWTRTASPLTPQRERSLSRPRSLNSRSGPAGPPPCPIPARQPPFGRLWSRPIFSPVGSY